MNKQHLLSEISTLNTPAEAFSFFSAEYPEQAVFSSSLGQEDQVITDMICRGGYDIEIFTLDTGRLFQETYELLDKTRSRYKKDIKSFFPQTNSLQELLRTKGPNSFYESVENRKECCLVRKVEPLQRALQGKLVWITGIRAEQSPNRSDMEAVEWDEANKVIKYHPLLHWTLKDVEQYLEEFNVPYNPLHNLGYKSIGCAPCTRAVLPGEDIRAGRWWWESSHKECGLHSHEPQKTLENAQ